MLSMVALFFSSSFFFFSIPVSLFMGSLPMQTIVNKWQRFNLFFKACTKDYVNSCLASPDNKLVSHSTICNTNLMSILGCGYARYTPRCEIKDPRNII